METSRNLSQVRIHVEHAIGRIKKFKILIPIKLIKRPKESNYATIDKMLVVCSALCIIISYTELECTKYNNVYFNLHSLQYHEPFGARLIPTHG